MSDHADYDVDYNNLIRFQQTTPETMSAMINQAGLYSLGFAIGLMAPYTYRKPCSSQLELVNDLFTHHPDIFSAIMGPAWTRLFLRRKNGRLLVGRSDVPVKIVQDAKEAKMDLNIFKQGYPRLLEVEIQAALLSGRQGDLLVEEPQPEEVPEVAPEGPVSVNTDQSGFLRDMMRERLRGAPRLVLWLTQDVGCWVAGSRAAFHDVRIHSKSDWDIIVPPQLWNHVCGMLPLDNVTFTRRGGLRIPGDPVIDVFAHDVGEFLQKPFVHVMWHPQTGSVIRKYYGEDSMSPLSQRKVPLL